MVGDDPELLVSDLQNEFPNDVLAIADHEKELVAQVVGAIDTPEQAALLPQGVRSTQLQTRVRAALDNLPADATLRLTVRH